MNRCDECRQPIHGEWVRIDAGATVGGQRIARDVNLHQDVCHAEWMLHNFPWVCNVRTREVSLPI